MSAGPRPAFRDRRRTRFYLTGLSGGARVALQVALANNNSIAGVIASSAGYPDSQPRASVPFALFGTAGTDDFNYIEMRQLDRKLTSPHRLAVFNGGHTLPPADGRARGDRMDGAAGDEVGPASEGRRARRTTVREAAAAGRRRRPASRRRCTCSKRAVEDFSGLRDVSAETARAADLSRQPEVKKALARERADDDAEVRLLERHLRAGSGPARRAAPRREPGAAARSAAQIRACRRRGRRVGRTEPGATRAAAGDDGRGRARRRSAVSAAATGNPATDPPVTREKSGPSS